MFTTPTRNAHFFDDVKNKREVIKKRKIDKTSKIDRRGYIFLETGNRGVKNLLFFDDFMLHFGRRRPILELR